MNILVVHLILLSLTIRFIAGSVEDNEVQLQRRITNMVEMLTEYGYPSEVHNVTTADGYILKMYRIPFGRLCMEEAERKTPVLLMHGLLANSMDFVLSGPDNALGLILADECYDVWLGNSRGNFESQNHITLDTDSEQFWNFTWHEMGKYDLPALVDYILNMTESGNQIHYIAHSQGTTEFFVYASLYPEESARKIKTMHALAPVAFMKNMRSPLIRLASTYITELELLVKLLGVKELIPIPKILALIGGDLCAEKYPDVGKICENLIFSLCGFDVENFNATLLPIIMEHDPAGSSTKQLFHYGQEVKSGRFCQYDYGETKNVDIYNSTSPPDYKIEDIKVRMYLHYSDNDYMAASVDVEKFASLTKNYSILHRVKVSKFNHLDFLWANNVRKVLYNGIITLLRYY